MEEGPQLGREMEEGETGHSNPIVIFFYGPRVSFIRRLTLHKILKCACTRETIIREKGEGGNRQTEKK